MKIKNVVFVCGRDHNKCPLIILVLTYRKYLLAKVSDRQIAT